MKMMWNLSGAKNDGPLFDISGLSEAHPVRFCWEPMFGIEGYVSVINEQLEWIENEMRNCNVDMKPEKYGARIKGLEVRNVNGNDEIYVLEGYEKLVLTGRRRPKLVSRVYKRYGLKLYQKKNSVYLFLRVFHARLQNKLLFIRDREQRKIQSLHPELVKALQTSSIVVTDSMLWLLKYAELLQHLQMILLTLNSHVEHFKMGMVRQRVRALALRHFALQECEHHQGDTSRLFVMKTMTGFGSVLDALDGNLLSNDKILLLGNSSDALSDWENVTEISPGHWLYTGVPSASTKANIPDEPEGGWPKISVVTVSYNQAGYIEESIKSIVDQGYPNLEYIIVDGNSSDGTVDILERYRDRVTKIVIESDEGQSDALNKGFGMATGDVMTWICSDDFLIPNALFHIGYAFATQKVDIVAGGCRIINGAGELTFLHHSALPLNIVQRLSFGDMLDFMGNWQSGDFFFQPEVFFSRRIWEKSGGFLRKHLYYAMDYDMFLRMAMAGATIMHISRTIGVSRQHSQQKTQHGTMEYLPQIHGILSDYKSIVQACQQSIANGINPPQSM